MSHEQRSVALRCEGVRKTFGETTVVDRLDLDVASGEICALLGPSGCGKTTTLRLIAGFEQPDSGAIAIGGRVVAQGGRGQAWALPPEQRRVGMVFQDYALFPHLSVRDNVGFGLERKHRQRADDMLALVGMDAFGDRMPGQLSGGQQQRVALARALAPRPDVLLLDEPFSNLDASLRGQVRADVRNILRAAGATAVLVTHDQEEAFTLADRVAIMMHGQIAQIGPPEVVYLRPADRAVADFLGEVRYLPGTAMGTQVSCVFGSVPLAAPACGPVFVVLRPEAVCLVSPEGVGAPGTVQAYEFLGAACLLTVTLDNGDVIAVRTGPYDAPQVGDRVHARLRGPVHVLTG